MVEMCYYKLIKIYFNQSFILFVEKQKLLVKWNTEITKYDSKSYYIEMNIKNSKLLCCNIFFCDNIEFIYLKQKQLR